MDKYAKLYAEERLTLGEVRALLSFRRKKEVSREETEGYLKENEAYLHYTPSDLEADSFL